MNRGLLNAVWLAALLAAAIACDSTATISARSVRFERSLVVSAVPLVENAGSSNNDDNLVPACFVEPEDVIAGFDINFVLQSSALESECAGERDRDRAIRPGDRIERRVVDPAASIGVEDFELDIQCVQPYPDENISSTVCNPGGVTGVNVNVENLEWKRFHSAETNVRQGPRRCEATSVALLIDQSGGMTGFVNPEIGYQQDLHGHFQIPGDEERRAVASDPDRHRLAAADDFISKLNARDELVVFGFQERSESADIEVLCDAPPLPAEGNYAGTPEYIRKALNCYGRNRAIVRNAVRSGYGSEEGRTPLWDAVARTYEFLRRDDVRAADNRHIVVITDSPDTCNAAGDEFLSHRAQCSARSFEDLRDLVVEGNSIPGLPPTHIHFVQIQARGYRDRDPRQQEIACLTGGHYIFINAFDTPRERGTPELSAALIEALSRIRYSLAGHWRMRVSSPTFDVSPNQVGYLAPGRLYSMAGELSFQSRIFTGEQRRVSVFDATGSLRTGAWDQRLAFRRACTACNQCYDEGTPDPCKIYCSEAQRICLAEPLERPNLQSDGSPTTCTTASVEDGVCCDGVCQAGPCGVES